MKCFEQLADARKLTSTPSKLSYRFFSVHLTQSSSYRSQSICRIVCRMYKPQTVCFVENNKNQDFLQNVLNYFMQTLISKTKYTIEVSLVVYCMSRCYYIKEFFFEQLVENMNSTVSQFPHDNPSFEKLSRITW